jgi:hypothetical protein
MSSFVSWFDITIFFLLVLVNFFLYKKNMYTKFVITILVVLIVFCSPYFSAKIEVHKIEEYYGANALDGFNYLYIWLRWPMYFIVFIFQIITIILNKRNKT